MIWKFDNSNTYLLGCIHAMKLGRHCYSEQIDYIYSQSTQIGIETNFDEIPWTLATYNDKNKLSDNISNKLFLKTRRQWLKHGFPELDLEKTKPWHVAEKLSFNLIEKRDFFLKHGIDNQLFIRAKADNKKLIFLEPAEIGLLCLDNAPPDEQETYLSSVVENPDKSITEFFALLKAWATSDISSLLLILKRFNELCPVIATCLINRDNAWLRTIATSIETKSSTLFAVGALHLADVHNIRTRLAEEHGYTSTPVINRDSDR